MKNEDVKIGSLYSIKKFYWLVQDEAQARRNMSEERNRISARRGPPVAQSSAVDASTVDGEAIIHAVEKHLPGAVSNWIKPGDYVVFLEEDGGLKKVLTPSGRCGWIWWLPGVSPESPSEWFEKMV